MAAILLPTQCSSQHLQSLRKRKVKVTLIEILLPQALTDVSASDASHFQHTDSNCEACYDGSLAKSEDKMTG